MGKLTTNRQRKTMHWYHYYVIVDLYFHSYFQESQEPEKSTEMEKEARLCIFNEYVKIQKLAYALSYYQSWDLCE